jgi:adenosylhomocysteine nucleosidase
VGRPPRSCGGRGTYLRTVDRKIAAVEMESGGFVHYFENPGFRGADQTWLMVKGISDHADENKTDSAQPLAADNSASAAFHIAAAFIDERRKAVGATPSPTSS